jgi:carboxypeptidase T
MKPIATFFFIFTLYSFSCMGQERYSRAQIFFNSKGGLKELLDLGLPVDHGEIKQGAYIISDFSEKEIKAARDKGFVVDIIINDVINHYLEQNLVERHEGEAERSVCGSSPVNYPTPQNFALGSMGGYFTFDEMVEILDDMASKYPNLITVKQSIGTSTEGRHLYMVKISDNPNVDENEPEIFYNALHHAREAASLSQLIFYMWYLLENYATNEEVKYLVDNTQMFFVPCINPDGYVFNQNNFPNGGGMWRKNRRVNGNGSFGVDLNRNYGHAWGFDNSGSSPSTSSDTYRGPSAFSEPETQAIRDFCNSRQFKLALNYHTYGNLLVYPWGYLPSYFTPDSALFVNYGKLLTRDNKYTFGTGDQTVGYVVNGDSDDWMYGEESTKAKIFSMTPEAGEASDGFWPPASKIEGICKENISQNLNLAHLALKYAIIDTKGPELISGISFYQKFDITNLGLASPANFTVSITPIKGISSVGASKTFNAMAVLEQRLDSIELGLIFGSSLGDEIKFAVNIHNGLYTYSDTITKYYGNGLILFAEDGTNMSKWNSSSWNTTTASFFSSPSSITDSPFGDYANNANTSITIKEPVDLSNATAAFLTFMGKWDVEANYDYVQLQASSNGTSWKPLCGKYTRPTTISNILGQPVYDGTQANWVEEVINLEEYLGEKVHLRFRLRSDAYVTADGLYFDDLKVHIMTNAGVYEGTEAEAFISIQPNPVKETATISYLLPQSAKNPKLLIMDINGKILEKKLLNPQERNTHFSTINLNAGIYFYTIEAEGVQMPVKKIAVIK